MRELSWSIRFTLLVCAMPVCAQEPVSREGTEEAALRAAADRVAPSVVQIRTIGGLEVVEGTVVVDGPTTGLIISPEGDILSSAFNFVQRPASIVVTLESGKQVPAELVATDHSRMLVLLKAKGLSQLPVPELAPVEETRPGQWAVALGRTFRAERTNVTVGIVSAVGRMHGRAIQTDADVSTANYGGPLVDLRGRVLGLVVPMSPQANSELAGIEWYDSGIGFAIPLGPLAPRLERMKKGEDQRSGVLGIGFLPSDPHTSPAELALVRPDSPAAKAGLKKGDRIVELDGRPIRNQSDLRFALGPHYGGDTVRVVALRGEERLERSVELAGELPPFRHASLGILPLRPLAKESDAEAKDDPADRANAKEQPSKDAGNMPAEEAGQPGVGVRMVLAGSPAEQAGVRRGDRLVEINGAKIRSLDDVRQVLNEVSSDAEVVVHLMRKNNRQEYKLKAALLPGSVPSELPPAYEMPAQAEAQEASTPGETEELRLPEFPHTCQVFVPCSQSNGESLAALLWIQSRGEAKPAEVIRQWQPECERLGIMLLVPQPKSSDHWERTDLEYLSRLMQAASAKYKVDPHRVVVGGRGNAGAICWPLALADRRQVRGILSVASPLPRQVQVPPNDPALRLAVFAVIPPKKDQAAVISEGLKKIADAGYNVATRTKATPAVELSEDERAELARWIDALDRF
ncbi:MAG: PDZ domain-containing protein [Pirellulales bacterium]|nr:PDZ domain-containing protein [Pirellulales bacterium]